MACFIASIENEIEEGFGLVGTSWIVTKSFIESFQRFEESFSKVDQLVSSDFKQSESYLIVKFVLNF